MLGLACALSVSLVTFGQSPGPLQRLLQAELERIPAKAGIYVKHLKTGEEAAVLPDERFNSASVIKIPVFVMGYQMSEKGALDFNARVPIGKADKRGGSGVLRYHDAGLQPTIRDVMMQMIITSDNTATDIAIARVGGVAAVNGWLQSNGYAPALKLNATILEVFRNRFTLADPKAKDLTAEDVYALGSNDLAYGTSALAWLESLQAGMQKPEVQAENVRRLSAEPSTWLGEITPRGVGRLLEAMETGKLTSAASAAASSDGSSPAHAACRTMSTSRWATRPAISRRRWPTTWASSTPARAQWSSRSS
jgi:hypothetical protein